MKPLSFLILAQYEEGWGGDEVFLLFGCAAATLVAGWWLIRSFKTVPQLGARTSPVLPLLTSLALSVTALVFVTWRWTAVEIRGGQDYAYLALAMGGGWFLLYSRLFAWLGVDLQQDACERSNPAAIVALAGAIPGGMFLYCGAICGEGPSFWNNVFTVLVAGGAWFLCWLVLDLFASISLAVSEERDVGAGIRLAGLLCANGLILGRAAAGNWEGMEATTFDLLRDGWPAFALAGAAIALERMLRRLTPPHEPSSRQISVLVATTWLVLAGLCVWYLGPWDGMPL
jgi:hypothetical protein